jgi:hypothetical protein
VGIEFTKRQVDLEQSLFDQLAAVLVNTCRGSAELKMMDDGELEAVNNFKAVLSSNLRSLLN